MNWVQRNCRICQRHHNKCQQLVIVSHSVRKTFMQGIYLFFGENPLILSKLSYPILSGGKLKRQTDLNVISALLRTHVLCTYKHVHHTCPTFTIPFICMFILRTCIMYIPYVHCMRVRSKEEIKLSGIQLYVPTLTFLSVQ